MQNFHFSEHGGPILWIILTMGVIGLGVFFERSLQLHRSRINVTDFLQGIFNSIRRGNIAEAKILCEDTMGPVARLTSLAISHRRTSREVFENDLNEIASAEISRMERRLSFVSLIAHITPMLGILGTILGILKSLIAMQANAPMVQTTDITPGLIDGCVTTIAGLVVSIPCYIGFHVLVIKIDRLILDMRHACSELMSFYDKFFVNDSTAVDAKEEQVEENAQPQETVESQAPTVNQMPKEQPNQQTLFVEQQTSQEKKVAEKDPGASA